MTVDQTYEIERKLNEIMERYENRKSQADIAKMLNIPIDVVRRVTQTVGIHHTVTYNGKNGFLSYDDFQFLLDYDF